MELTPEDKAHLIDEINGQTNNRPLFYLKFCREKKFAQDVCDGNLFGNTAEYFRQQEIKSGERGQGDRFETVLHLETENITAVDLSLIHIYFKNLWLMPKRRSLR